mmetsp:Transcript_3472/g.2936  ORF Transcript_3472/g.2936 Transcript_3472/m.2936 type:complete len:111 (+) Transcript_3472:1141-1473(+)
MFIGPMIWVYSAETLTEKGMCLASGVNWLMYTVTITLPLFPSLISKNPYQDELYHLHSGMFFFSFSGLSILFFFLFIVFVLETKGLTDYKITKLFKSKRYHSLSNKMNNI